MNIETLPGALIEWATETLPELTGSYDHVPAAKPEALPDVICEVARSEVLVGGGELFPFWQIQNSLVEAHECNLAFMVDNSDPQAAAAQLRRFQNELKVAALSQENLGGRVPFRSPFISFDFTAPFVEYEDGTKGREMTLTMTVGDLVQEAE